MPMICDACGLRVMDEDIIDGVCPECNSNDGFSPEAREWECTVCIDKKGLFQNRCSLIVISPFTPSACPYGTGFNPKFKKVI